VALDFRSLLSVLRSLEPHDLHNPCTGAVTTRSIVTMVRGICSDVVGFKSAIFLYKDFLQLCCFAVPGRYSVLYSNVADV
jgi:hypothetical protein